MALGLMLASALRADLAPAELAAEAQTAAGQVRPDDQRALALAEVAVVWQQLGDSRWEENLKLAGEIVAAVEDPFTQALAWRGLALRAWTLQPEQARRWSLQAVQQARQVKYPARRSLALLEIGRSLAPLDRDMTWRTLLEAISVADSLEAPLVRAGALREAAEVVRDIEAELAGDLYRRAAGLLQGIHPQDEAVQLAQVELLSSWCLLDLPAAQKEIDNLTAPGLEIIAWQGLCRALAPGNPEQALAVAGNLPPGPQRSLALATVAAHLPLAQGELARGLVASAVELGGTLDEAEVPLLQAEVAVALAGVDLEAALRAAGEIEEAEAREAAVGRMATRLGPHDLAQALRVADTLPDCPARDQALVKLIPLLAAQNPPAALERARGLLVRREKVRALLAICGIISAGNKVAD
jgi:hypothetical protein